MKKQLASTREAIDGREHMANILENNFSALEKNLLNMQLRLYKLIQHWHKPIISFVSTLFEVYLYMDCTAV